ncbi:MAG: hypothetical protein RLZZ528_463 [Pseudomonadota bacterium]
MGFLTHDTTVLTGALGSGARITDLAVRTTASGTFLYAGAQPGSATLMALSLAQGQTATLIDTQGVTGSITYTGSTTVDFLPTPTGTAILAAGHFGAEVGGYLLSSNGMIGGSRSYSDGAGQGGQLAVLEVLPVTGATWIYGALAGGSGIAAWRMTPGTATLVQQATLADDSDAYLDGVGTLISAQVSGQAMLFAASPYEHGVTALTVGSDGSLTVTGRIGAAEGLGMTGPAAMEDVTLAGQSFLVVAATQSSSLSVLRIDPGGLVPVDHVTDSLSTRFQSPVAVETFTLGDRAYVLTGGGDDGLTLFHLLPDGRLIFIETLLDSSATALQNVAAIEAVQVGNQIQVFVASAVEDGLSQFTFTPPASGPTRIGTAADDALTGGANDDILTGGRGDDSLAGGGGDDILVDGSGADALTGGSGADLFVLVSDGADDRVLDFNKAEDRLDLSDFGLIYSVSQIAVTSTATGAILTFGAGVVEVFSHDGSPLTAADFTDANTLNLPRSPVELIISGRIETGGAGDDTIAGSVFSDSLSGAAGDDLLTAQSGDDTLDGGSGADTLDGGAGRDRADYASATAGVTADLATPARNTGDAAGDVYLGIEDLAGSDHADDLTGDGAANEILGRDGGDLLSGGGGSDTLDGGAGDDTLRGGAGADALIGGPGFDTADFSGSASGVVFDLSGAVASSGAAAGDIASGIEAAIGTGFADHLLGTGQTNSLTGGQGADTLAGGGGDDSLDGGAGADRIDGGTGFDIAIYRGASAGLLADLASAARNTGEAAGDVFLALEGLEGSAFADDLRGDGAANLLRGGDGTDWLTGRGGNDTLEGGDGNDNLSGGAGADQMNGGNGSDRAVYTDGTGPMTLDLANNGLNTGEALGDVLVSVENVKGTAWPDLIYGDALANLLDGYGGNDSLWGRDGNDELQGRGGNDLLSGGNDNDQFFGGNGADTLDGGNGVDRANYGDSATGLTADLLNPASNTGFAAGDVYIGIEDLQGTAAADRLFGDNAANTITGARGSDLIKGRDGGDYLLGVDGADTLVGGAGSDSLLGGTGADVFVFVRGAQVDRVLDLSLTQDVILLDRDIPAIAGMTAAQVVAAFGTTVGGDVFLDFGGGDVLVVKGFTDPTALIPVLGIGDTAFP